MAHVTEEKLLRYAIDRALVDDAEAIERHLAECAECRDAMESIRLFDAALRDPESWIDAPSSPGFEELRRLAENVGAEDAEARELLAEFEDASAARFAWADLPSNPDYYSGGVVRALNKRANGMCERDLATRWSSPSRRSQSRRSCPSRSIPRPHCTSGEGRRGRSRRMRCITWDGLMKRGRRSEEHTSELQSQSNIVCR